jgi:formate/nitrite transporter FocA (FNT family)
MADKKSDDFKSGSPHLDEEEKAQATEHASPRAVVIHEIIREEGEQELERTNSALALSGLAGGLSMGFSFLTQALLHASLSDSPWRHAVDSLGYSVGFIIVVLGRQQLFTESTLTAVLPAITRRNAETLLQALRLWAVVLAVNLAGTWLFALMLTTPGVFPAEVTSALRDLASHAVGPALGVTFLKAVLAGWLIALMVWILPSARSARLLTIIIITYVVALAQLVHVVASSAEIAYAVISGLASFSDYLVLFLLPTLLGNVVGGVALVSLLNHGSVRPEMKGQKRKEKGRAK